jgi:hypothetical protein
MPANVVSYTLQDRLNGGLSRFPPSLPGISPGNRHSATHATERERKHSGGGQNAPAWLASRPTFWDVYIYFMHALALRHSRFKKNAADEDD